MKTGKRDKRTWLLPAAALGMIDGVIAVEETRERVQSAVSMCLNKRAAASPSRKHANFAF